MIAPADMQAFRDKHNFKRYRWRDLVGVLADFMAEGDVPSEHPFVKAILDGCAAQEARADGRLWSLQVAGDDTWIKVWVFDGEHAVINALSVECCLVMLDGKYVLSKSPDLYKTLDGHEVKAVMKPVIDSLNGERPSVDLKKYGKLAEFLSWEGHEKGLVDTEAIVLLEFSSWTDGLRGQIQEYFAKQYPDSPSFAIVTDRVWHLRLRGTDVLSAVLTLTDHHKRTHDYNINLRMEMRGDEVRIAEIIWPEPIPELGTQIHSEKYDFDALNVLVDKEWPTLESADPFHSLFRAAAVQDLWGKVRFAFMTKYNIPMEAYFLPDTYFTLNYADGQPGVEHPSYMVLAIRIKERTEALVLSIAIEMINDVATMTRVIEQQPDFQRAVEFMQRCSRNRRVYGGEPGEDGRMRGGYYAPDMDRRFNESMRRRQLLQQGPLTMGYVWDQQYRMPSHGDMGRNSWANPPQMPPEPLPDSTFGGQNNAEIRQRFVKLEDIQPVLDALLLRYPDMGDIVREIIPNLLREHGGLSPRGEPRREFHLHVIGDWFGLERYGCVMRLVGVDKRYNRIFFDTRFEFYV